MQPRLHVVFEGVDIVLELSGKEFPNLGVEAFYVGDESQQPEQHQQHDGDDEVHLDARVAREPDPVRLTAGPRERTLLGRLSLFPIKTFPRSGRFLLSINPTGNPSDFRKLASLRAISPLSSS